MNLKQEMEVPNTPDFTLGEYIYMGMAKLKGKTVCISIGYKIDYSLKKAILFSQLDDNISFYKINKVKVGELTPITEFLITDHIKKEYLESINKISL